MVFNALLIFSIVVNVKFTLALVNGSLLTNVLTVMAIVFGFIMSAVSNLFGRKVTYEMANKTSKYDPGLSQLQELKGCFSHLMYCCLFLIVVSLVGLVAYGSVEVKELLSLDLIAYSLSAVYLYVLLFSLFAFMANSIILFNLLLNDAVL